jgi:hypothetical protein
MDLYKRVEFTNYSLQSLIGELNSYLELSLPGYLAYRYVDHIVIEPKDGDFVATIFEQLDENEIKRIVTE